MRAIQAWRWMTGASHILQSYIVRVPESELDERLALITAEQHSGLPAPNIVDVPDGQTNEEIEEDVKAELAVFLDRLSIKTGLILDFDVEWEDLKRSMVLPDD